MRARVNGDNGGHTYVNLITYRRGRRMTVQTMTEGAALAAQEERAPGVIGTEVIELTQHSDRSTPRVIGTLARWGRRL
jgi:predicted NBD/HSP70 family sugar kinase